MLCFVAKTRTWIDRLDLVVCCFELYPEETEVPGSSPCGGLHCIWLADLENEAVIVSKPQTWPKTSNEYDDAEFFATC